MTRYSIGLDSTDSAEKGMCTTYLGAVLIERLEVLPVELFTYPELIRLNPNVPWKTRGNGAVCLRYVGEENLEDEIMAICIESIEDMSIFEDPQTNPGLAVLTGEPGKEMNDLYHSTLHEIVTVEEALRASENSSVSVRGWKNRKGIIGSIASIGADLPGFTFEAIMYRPGNIKERKRRVDRDEIRQISKRYGKTFFNIDESGEPVCIPHSPCPVILGIRSTDPSQAREGLLQLNLPDSERWVLWKTNQHTDSHIKEVEKAEEIKPYSSVSFETTIMTDPVYGDGGHLSFDIEVDDLIIKAWAYEPTKGFRKDLSGLLPGDRIKVWGSVREPSNEFGPGINLEKVMIIQPVEVFNDVNPRCPECGGPTGSMGKGQGLRCKSCGFRDGLKKISKQVQRGIQPGIIQPPMNAWRHLFKPADMDIPVISIASKPFYGIIGNRKQGLRRED